jgi:hypothetical protein
MEAQTLFVKEILILNEIQAKLANHKLLTIEEQNILAGFLSNLPESEMILHDKVSLDESFEIKMFDVERNRQELDKWIDLFHTLPKHRIYPYAALTEIDEDGDREYVRKGVIIEFVFVPSYFHSLKEFEPHRIFDLKLKINGTAVFTLRTLEDIELYPDLYSFNGSWKDAFILVVQTLKKGWPQEPFPKKFEHVLSRV